MAEGTRVLVAGIAGASLGTEIIKCLRAAGGYAIFGCDISPYAYGHYAGELEESFVIPKEGYTDAVLRLCREHDIRAVVPGGEEPLALLVAAAESFRREGVTVVANAPEVIATCSDKQRFLERLRALGLAHPRSFAVASEEELLQIEELPLPCVVKPATGSGGSVFVFLAATAGEARGFVQAIVSEGRVALLQEYLPHAEGEYSVGVLSLPDGRIAGSVAMRKVFTSKLSIAARTRVGLIASPYSQGLIDDFPEVRAQAECLASRLGSVGPLNIQGRLREGAFVPFEVNARFSGGTYLRALAGFNEVDVYLRAVLEGAHPEPFELRRGYYLRSLSEVYVPAEGLRQ